jgi:exodeoxyribonuclease-3
VKAEMQTQPNFLIMGDYNITFDALDVWDPETLEGTIHCTQAERDQLQALIALGLTDSVRLFEQPEKNYSWWDYRDFAFRRNRGLRIDHVLISDALKAKASKAYVDKAPRKNERPSDHAPVVFEATF